MKDKSTKKGLIIIIVIIILLIAIAGLILYVVVNANDNNPIEEKTLEKLKKEEQKKKETNDKLQDTDTFLKVIKELKYIDSKDLYIYDPIGVPKSEELEILYNPSNGKKITESTGAYGWYGYFGVIYYDDYSKIVDDQGKELFMTEEEIEYYPQSEVWFFGNNLYNKDGLLEKGASLLDEDNNLIIAEKNNKLIVEDINLKEIYSLKLDKNDTLLDSEIDSIYDEQYAFIQTEKLSIILNIKNGKEVYKTKSDNIKYLGNNIFEIDKATYFIKNDKLALKVNEVDSKTEASINYIAIGNHVYDVNTLKEIDTNTYIPDYLEAYIEKNTGLEKTKCRSGYGLKYKGEVILECKYSTIDYFNEEITNSLISSNKLYIIISKDDSGYELYDVFRKKTIHYNIYDYDTESPYITKYEDDNIYIYNIIDGSKGINPDGDEITLFRNYYILSDNKYDTYYNKDFKEILKLEKNKNN